VVALLGDGKLPFLVGGIDEYLERRAARGQALRPTVLLGAGSGAGAGSGRGAGSVAGQAPGAAGRQRAARKELQQLERQIERLTTREKELTDLLAAHASDYTRQVELAGQLRGIQADKARLEEDWLTVAEEGERT
jgi:ATP-binding cassette subfamily F protein uup